MGKSLKGKELGIGITQRKDSKYSAKFKSKSGKRVEKYFDKLSDARKWLSEAQYQDAHGNIGSSTSMTVNTWFEYWISEIKGKTTRYNTVRNYKDRYIQNIKELIGNMIISDVKPLHCQKVLNVMDNEGYAGSTMQNTKITMSAIFSDALENGLISDNPVTKSVKCPKKKEKCTRVLTLDEQEKFLTAAKGSINYNHFLFILQTGVRSSELRGLRWEDVDFKNRVIHIRQNVTYDYTNKKFVIDKTKTISGQRDIPMTQIVYNLLMNIKDIKVKQMIVPFEFADHIFLNSKGKLLPNSSYNKYLERICNKAGIENISMHILRHTFATRCIEAGMKPKTLQEILGHANISTTMDLYVHVTGDEKAKEMQQFEKIIKMA